MYSTTSGLVDRPILQEILKVLNLITRLSSNFIILPCSNCLGLWFSIPLDFWRLCLWGSEVSVL